MQKFIIILTFSFPAFLLWCWMNCYWLHLWLVNVPNDQVYLSCLFGKEILRLSSGKMPTILKIVSWNYDFLVCMAMLFTSLLSILSWIVTSIFGPLLCIIVSPLFSITLNMWSVIMVEIALLLYMPSYFRFLLLN